MIEGRDIMETVIILVVGLLALAFIIRRVGRTASTGDCAGGCAGGCNCHEQSCPFSKGDEIDHATRE